MIEAVRVIYEQQKRIEDINSANVEPVDRHILTARQKEQIWKAGGAVLCTEAEVSGTIRRIDE